MQDTKTTIIRPASPWPSIDFRELWAYRELLLQYAEVRGLKRYLVPVPFLTPRLSSYWLYFVTSTSYSLARALVDSLSHDMSSHDSRIRELVPKTNFFNELRATVETLTQRVEELERKLGLQKNKGKGDEAADEPPPKQDK